MMNKTKEYICSECRKCVIRKDSVFSVFTGDDIDELQNAKNHLTFSAGELIFKEGHYPFGIYIIVAGKVKIIKNGFEGREQIVRFARGSDILGYRALISEEKYSCSAMAVTETQVCFLPKVFVSKHINANPKLGVQFMKLLAHDLKSAEEKTIRLAQKPVRERMAESILVLIDVYGYEEDKSTLNISLKRDEIASVAGTVRETATRLLSDFCEEGIIELKGRSIKVTDLNRLVQCANNSF
jgi:CRP/FNR family transcriptional regulator